MEFSIEKCTMHILRKKNTNNRKQRTAKINHYQDARIKGNLQITGTIGSGYYQTSGDERKE